MMGRRSSELKVAPLMRQWILAYAKLETYRNYIFLFHFPLVAFLFVYISISIKSKTQLIKLPTYATQLQFFWNKIGFTVLKISIAKQEVPLKMQLQMEWFH